MTGRTLLLEVIRNIHANLLTALLLGVVAAGSGGLVAVASGLQVHQIVQQHDQLLDQGVDVWRVQSSTSFDADRCDALRSVKGVADAGAPIRRSFATVDGLPGATLEVVHATAGFIRIVLNSRPVNAFAVAVGADAGSNYGIRRNARISLHYTQNAAPTEDVTVDYVADPTERLRGANEVLYISVYPSGRTNECLVEALPGARSALEGYLLSAFAEGSSVSPLYAATTAEQQYNNALGDRVTLWFPLFAGVVAVSLASLTTYLRRAEWALYQLLGVGRGALVAMLVVETALMLWCPFSGGVLIGLLLLPREALMSPVVVTELWSDTSRAALLLTLPPVLSALTLRRSSSRANWLKGQ